MRGIDLTIDFFADAVTGRVFDPEDFGAAAFLALAGARAAAFETGFDVRLAEPAFAFCLLMTGLAWLNK